MGLKAQVSELQQLLKQIDLALKEIAKKIEGRNPPPYSIPTTNDSLNVTVTPKSGLGIYGGTILWNDKEGTFPPMGKNPGDPSSAYNLHSHSQYSGGALDINTLEIVEYEYSSSQNKHCPSLWHDIPSIKTDNNENKKVGLIDGFVWDKYDKVWKVTAVYADETS